ncbi:Oidioi.mRNA.OKI2018_I69.chr2.g4813.t1.cds [Oikopleura dioica]|uniref:Oidioi.mRNA.OKI2018_I69.chr2.g4813.t1.cds n=1 Tax=Oikopleura dioica TaxID=34765 RepID=A0ABN7T033_OIKDI|nr:Oidioi.mRNA.OKI2018_I69.chr2.g4813.t1.cds [Oikopleura dioica]
MSNRAKSHSSENIINPNYSTEYDEEEDEDEFSSFWAFNSLLGLLAAIGMALLIVFPYWVETDLHESSSLLGDVRVFKGFWTQCLTRMESQWQCAYYSFNGHFSMKSIQGLQLCSVLSATFIWISWTLSFYGGQYLKILENEKTKAWLVLAGGIIALFGIVFWWMMIGLLSDVVSDEYERELYFDSQVAVPMPSYPSHSISRRSSSGGGAVFSSDDFKFRQGTCFYIALPVGILATINMVLLLVEGITRVKNAPEEEEESYRKGSTPSDQQNLLKEVTPIYSESSIESIKQQRVDVQEAEERNWI